MKLKEQGAEKSEDTSVAPFSEIWILFQYFFVRSGSVLQFLNIWYLYVRCASDDLRG